MHLAVSSRDHEHYNEHDDETDTKIPQIIFKMLAEITYFTFVIVPDVLFSLVV